MSNRCKLRKEYYKQNGNYRGSCNISYDYVKWLENEVLALRQPLVISSFCDECIDGSGWYGDEDITYNCSKCNPEAN